MLPPATQREIEVCLAKLLVDTSSSLVVVLSPTAQVLAWQGMGVYDALIQEQASGQGPTLDPNVREHIAPPSAPTPVRPREYGSWIAPDLFLWLLAGPATSVRLLQRRTPQTAQEVRAVLRRAGVL